MEINGVEIDSSTLKKVIQDRMTEDDFFRETGVKFESVECGRDLLNPPDYFYIFKLNDKTYRCNGYYDSYEGVTLDSYEVEQSFEVSKQETIVYEWLPVK